MEIALIHYPSALKSALYGIEEMLEMANAVGCDSGCHFEVKHLDAMEIITLNDRKYNFVFIPPAQVSSYYLKPDEALLDWLRVQNLHGAVICSACAGAFILAATGLTKEHSITTHWGLAEQLRELYPDQKIDSDKILINETDVITAGGMMSWIDLGLELIKVGFDLQVMRKVGKNLVIDTAPRDQRFYQQFSPNLAHGDALVLSVQKHIHTQFNYPLKIRSLAEEFNLSERTLLRRFQSATGLKPSEYISHYRIHKCCELLETTRKSFESIVCEIGYEDVSTCRKAFKRIMGLSPAAFRKRFTDSFG